MELKDVIEKLIEIHKKDQHEAGHDDADQVSPSCCPLSDLEGFDSLLIPPIVRRLARELGCPLAKGTRVKNIYGPRERKLNLEDVARRFLEEYAPQESRV